MNMQSINFQVVRFIQLFRELKTLGLLYSLLLILSSVAAFYFFYKVQVSDKGILISGIVIAILLQIIHVSRSDHRFISLAVENPRRIYLMEYFVFTVPFIILSLISSGKPFMLLLLVVILVISSIPVTTFKISAKSRTAFLINDRNFEWKAGMRKSGVVLVILWIAALALLVVPFASLVVLWFLLLAVSGYYEAGESREMIESYEMDARKFIHQKLKEQLMTFLIPIIPILVTSMLLYPERWWVFCLFAVFSLLNLAVFIVSKYAVWRPGEINRASSIVNVICMFGLFLPFFLPLPIFVFIRNYRKSIVNLQPLLHDYYS